MEDESKNKREPKKSENIESNAGKESKIRTGTEIELREIVKRELEENTPQSGRPKTPRQRKRYATETSETYHLDDEPHKVSSALDPTGFFNDHINYLEKPVESTTSPIAFNMVGTKISSNFEGQVPLMLDPTRLYVYPDSEVPPTPDQRQRRLEKKVDVCEKSSRWYYFFTTVQGLEQMKRSNWQGFKVFWLVVFITGCGLTMWGTTQIVNRYTDKDKVSQVKINSSMTSTFPQVTVCSMHGLNCNNFLALLQKGKNLQILCQIYALSKCEVILQRAAVYHQGKKHKSVFAEMCIKDIHKLQIKEDEVRKNKLLHLLAKLEEDSIKQMSQSPKDFIFDCKLSDTKRTRDMCSAMQKGLYGYFIAGYGFCPTFRSPKGKKALVVPHSSSYFNMRTLQLKLHLDSFWSTSFYLGYPKGVSVFVHRYDEKPQGIGTLVQPNTDTMLYLKPKQYEQIYEKEVCNNDTGHEIERCQWECFTDLMKDQSACTPLKEEGMRPNNIVEQIICPQNVMEKFILYGSNETIYKKEGCKCLPACTTKELQKTTTSLEWPPDHLHSFLLDERNKTILGMKTWTDGEDQISTWEEEMMTNFSSLRRYAYAQGYAEENFLKISVRFQNSMSEEISEQFQFSDETLLEDLGGSLSLYLGLTLLSLLELVELGIRLIYGLWKH